MRIRRRSPGLKQDPLELWIAFFRETKETSRNEEILFDFFAEECMHQWDTIPHFLKVLKKEIRSGDAEHRAKIARRYLSILSPLLERMGLFDEKSQMDTACFKLIDPHAFLEVETMVRNHKKT